MPISPTSQSFKVNLGTITLPAIKSGGGMGGLYPYDALCLMVKSNFAKKAKPEEHLKLIMIPLLFSNTETHASWLLASIVL